MKGKLFIIVGPSGSGKSSVLHKLMELKPNYVYPLSATTRPMREGEKDGDIYHFMTKEEFKKGIKEDMFLEWAIVHQDNYYGLIKGPIMKGLKEGKTIIREVDIQGFDSIRKKIAPEDLVTIFVTVPNKEELIERIISRATISLDELEKRKKSMHREFNRAKDCDYMVENKEGKLEETVKKVMKIIEDETKKV
ncbi:guanylate kinase [Candidatus Peregrinibacteria bacterium]|nr:guanylate kinase [Candidatus Peregrinibacteria bacterium]